MFIQIALISSVVLQFGAFFNTLKLIRRTRFNVSWITISIAFFLMAIRRLSELATFANSNSSVATEYFNSWVAVLISLLMFVASFYIRRIFNLQASVDNMRKENEVRVLSAIIATEEKERKSFARELHDGLGPVLSSVKMAFSAIDTEAAGEKNKQIIEKTEVSVDNAIITVREISNNLSPHLLEKFSLKKAIRTSLVQLNVGAILGIGAAKLGFKNILKKTEVNRFFVMWLIAPIIAFFISLLLIYLADIQGLIYL